MASIKMYARPLLLFRYRSLDGDERFDREMDAIRRGYIYCSTYRDMNDPMEGFYRASERVAEHPEYDEFTESVKSQKLALRIASLSETWDNELMWSHYAEGFKGVCIAYAVDRMMDNMADNVTFSRVAYGDRPYYLNLRGMRNERERAHAILSTKSAKWTYEREWRLFSPTAAKPRCGVDAMTTVYLGSRMSPEMRREVRDALDGTGIQIRRTTVDGYTVKRLPAR